MKHETHPFNEPCCCQCGSSAHECGDCPTFAAEHREVSANEVERREKTHSPRLGYPGADQMMRWQKDYK